MVKHTMVDWFWWFVREKTLRSRRVQLGIDWFLTHFFHRDHGSHDKTNGTYPAW